MQKMELLENVISDLRYLRDDWDESVDTNNLRRGSPILRRLLVEGDLQKAWRLSGRPHQPRITAESLTYVLQSIPRNRIRLAAVGGAMCNNVAVDRIVELNYCITEDPEDPAWNALCRTDAKETLILDQFVASPCMIVEGAIILRRHVIQFAANRLGGVHFDAQATKRKSRKRRKEDDLLFRTIERATEIAQKPIVYYEILSIGQCLAKAKDISALINMSSS